MLSFQSVLGEVIDEFNNYFEGLQGKRRRDLNEFFIKPYLIHYNRESNCRYSPTWKRNSPQSASFLDRYCMLAEPGGTEQLVCDRVAAEPRGSATTHADCGINCDGRHLQRRSHKRASYGLLQESLITICGAWWRYWELWQQRCSSPRQYIPSQPGQHIERPECRCQAYTNRASESDSNACFWCNDEWYDHGVKYDYFWFKCRSYHGYYDSKQHLVDGSLIEFSYYRRCR